MSLAYPMTGSLYSSQRGRDQFSSRDGRNKQQVVTETEVTDDPAAMRSLVRPAMLTEAVSI
jgi:hypothetical protein